MAEAVDPFTQGYVAIWTALDARAEFTKLVRLNNVNDFSDGGTTATVNKSSSRAPADYMQRDSLEPGAEVSLVPAAFSMAPFGSNSKSADLGQSYQLIVAVEQLQIVPLNKVKYQAFIALLKAGDDLGLTGLCRGWNITGAQDGSGGVQVAGRSVEAGKRGFAAILSINLDMYLSRATLLAS